jgi:hypothetical protein
VGHGVRGTASGLVPCVALRQGLHTARPLRIEFAGALYHVTSRGDGREAIYVQDQERHHPVALHAPNAAEAHPHPPSATASGRYRKHLTISIPLRVSICIEKGTSPLAIRNSPLTRI